MSYKEMNLFTKRFHKEHTRKEWLKKFVEYAEKKEDKYGESCGVFMCGFYWCCDRCKIEIANGCWDCVMTIVKILDDNGIVIDYNDFNFNKWETKAKQLESEK